MKELGPHTKYVLVERFDPNQGKNVLVSHPIPETVIDHGPRQALGGDDEIDDLTSTGALEPETIKQIKASRWTSERWARDSLRHSE